MRLGLKHGTVGSLIIVLLVGFACGQTTTSGGLTGVVVDQTGAVIPDALVKISDLAKGTTDSAKTDSMGAYQFSFLRPATYTLTVEHSGFKEERRSVLIQVGPTLTVNVTLRIATRSSEVLVTDEAATIQADNADVSVTINQKQIAEVPNPGNDLTYVAQTAPGAVMNTDGGFGSKFSILGMPGFSYAFTVDGVDITNNYLNNVRGEPVGITLGANQTEEATVVTSINSGQFGGAAGGNINYVTKSGSNLFHGNAEYFWNGTVLNANDWFINANGQPKPVSIANQWAGSLGGPIRKNRLFFFFDTEGLRLVIPQLQLAVIPTPQFEAATIANIQSKFGLGSASDLFYQTIFRLYDSTPGASSAKPGDFLGDFGCGNFTGLGMATYCARNIVSSRSRPSQDTLTSGRVDWNVGRSDRAFLKFQEEGGVGAANNDPISPVFDSEVDSWRWQGQLLETHTFSSVTAAQFLVGASDHYWSYRDSHLAEALAAFPTTLGFWVTGSFTNLAGFNDYYVETRALMLSADLTSTKRSHKLGFGAKMDREKGLERQRSNANGQLLPQTLQAFYEGGFDPASPGVDFTTLQKDFNDTPNPSYIYGGIQAYIQDEWRARKNLVLTFALRVEHRTNFSCESNCFSRLSAPFEGISHDPNQPYKKVLLKNQNHALPSFDPINWSPRFGFAWQPFGVSHSSVLRGGAGILYDPFQDALAEVFWTNPPSYNSFTTFGDNLAPNETSNLFKDAQDSNDAFHRGYEAGATLADLQHAIPHFFPPSLNSSERKMHRPQYQRWNLEWEQGLGVTTSVTIGYFGHHGIHELVGDPNTNAYGFGSLPATPCSSPPVPPCSDPRFAGVTQWSSRAISNYNGMVATYRHHFSGWGSGLVELNYTYGHALDEVSNNGLVSFAAGSSLSPQDPSNLHGAYGNAEYDVRHSMNANYVWELPLKSALRGHGPDALLKGWQVSGTFFARTGLPYTVFDMALSGNLRQNNFFGSIYAVPAGPFPKSTACGGDAAFVRNTHPCLPPQYFVRPDGTIVLNPNALFVQATCEIGFNAGRLPIPGDPCGRRVVSFAQGRNRFRGPSYFNTDLAVMKNTKIPGWENGTLAIGFQFFNVLNHPNFGFPDNWSSDPTFGSIFYMEQSPSSILGTGLNAATAARMIQLRAELRF